MTQQHRQHRQYRQCRQYLTAETTQKASALRPLRLRAEILNFASVRLKKLKHLNCPETTAYYDAPGGLLSYADALLFDLIAMGERLSKIATRTGDAGMPWATWTN